MKDSYFRKICYYLQQKNIINFKRTTLLFISFLLFTLLLIFSSLLFPTILDKCQENKLFELIIMIYSFSILLFEIHFYWELWGGEESKTKSALRKVILFSLLYYLTESIKLFKPLNPIAIHIISKLFILILLIYLIRMFTAMSILSKQAFNYYRKSILSVRFGLWVSLIINLYLSLVFFKYAFSNNDYQSINLFQNLNLFVILINCITCSIFGIRITRAIGTRSGNRNEWVWLKIAFK